MNRRNSKLWTCTVFICCATFLFCSSAQASGQEDGTSLMLEVTPPQGGSLNIVPGVYSYDKFAEVVLVATPKPGYQFVYWMGNVTNAATGTTTVFLDSPKMVIAVFERSKFEMVGLEGDYMVGGEGSGRMVRSGGESDTSLEQAVSGQESQEIRRPHVPHNIPVPDENKPVPEPATITLLFTGLLMLVNRRNKGVNLMDKM